MKLEQALRVAKSNMYLLHSGYWSRERIEMEVLSVVTLERDVFSNLKYE